MIDYKTRVEILKNPNEIDKYFQIYHIPSAESALDFINRFVYTYDPRRKFMKVLPLTLFPRQEEYVRWLWERYTNDESGVVDKCRTAGASWVTMAFFAYLFLFQKNVSLCAYTYKAEECHKLGDISTLLQKVAFIIEHLPKKFRNGVTINQMYFKNPRLGSDIAGSSGDNPGRGGRRTMIMTDEESFYQRAELIEAALSETSNCRISVSTHSGTTSLFYRKCQSSMEKFIFNWWDDPRNSQEWFDTKKQDAIDKGTLHIFKREIERDAAASLAAVVCPSDWVTNSTRCNQLRDGKIIAGLDPANEGGDTHGFVVVNGNYPIYAAESGEGDPGDATDVFFWKAVELGVEEFRYDPIGVGAGVKVRIKEIFKKVEEDPKLSREEKEKILKIKVIPWSASGSVMRPMETDYQDKPNDRLFENAKAQAWWKIREEFRNTYRYVSGKDHDSTKLVGFPDNGDKALLRLKQEISQPQYCLSSSGRTMIDKKPKGTKSPNLADAYIICRAEVEIEWIKWDSF